MLTPQINLLVIRTKQLKALAEFYTLLGMKFQYHRHGIGPYHYAAEMDDFIFEIYPFLKNQIAIDKSIRLGFIVDDLEKTIVNLEEHNVKILKAPSKTEWGFQAVIKDIDERKIELTQVSF